MRSTTPTFCDQAAASMGAPYRLVSGAGTGIFAVITSPREKQKPPALSEASTGNLFV